MDIPTPSPTPPGEHQDRQRRLRSAMAADHVDLLVCYGDAWRTANIRYLTDFRPVDGINGIEQSVLLFSLTAEPQLFVADGLLGGAQEVTPFPVRPLSDLPLVTAAGFGASSHEAVAVAGSGQMPAPVRAALTGILGHGDLVDTYVLAKTKAVKSDWEMQQLRHAAALTDLAMVRVREIITSGEEISERDLARQADAAMIQAGADGVAFLSMVQSGPRSTFSLALPSHRTIQTGDIVLTDIGARYGNYVADGGRGFTVGEVSKDVIDLVNSSAEAVEAGLTFARPGISASALNRQIQGVLIDRGYAEYSVEARGRGTGHGTGMDPEEEVPWIGPSNEEILTSGMVFTLKATINKPGIGGLRTERVVHLTEDGATPLDQFPMRNHW